MTPCMMRQLWTLIEDSQPSTLLTLDDNGLVMWIMNEMETDLSFDRREADVYSQYIRTRLPLIRDIVAAR